MSCNKTKLLLKNVGILTISNFASKILVFLLVPLYTSVLTTEEYGIYDLVISTITLFYPILTLNIIDGVMRFSIDKQYSKNKIAVIGIKFSLYSIVTFTIGMFLLHTFKIWTDIYGLEIFIVLYYIVYTFNQFIIQFVKGLEKITDMGIAGVIATFVTISTNILLLLVFKLGLIGFFIANIASQTASLVFLFFRVKLWKYFSKLQTDDELIKEMLAYSVPLVTTVVSWWVNSTADKYVVVFMVGISANGILSVAYKIPQIINTLQGIFIQAWQISAIKEYGNNGVEKFYGNTFQVINILMCIVCSCLILLTRPLAKLLYAKNFYQAWQYVPFLMISIVINCASGMLGPILSAQKNSKAMMQSAIIGAGINIVLNIILVHFIDIQGATIATLICSYIIYQVRKIAVGKNIYIDKYWIVLITWGFLCIQGIIEVYINLYWLEIIIMCALLVLNFDILRKMIINAKSLILENKIGN